MSHNQECDQRVLEVGLHSSLIKSDTAQVATHGGYRCMVHKQIPKGLPKQHWQDIPQGYQGSRRGCQCYNSTGRTFPDGTSWPAVGAATTWIQQATKLW